MQVGINTVSVTYGMFQSIRMQSRFNLFGPCLPFSVLPVFLSLFALGDGLQPDLQTYVKSLPVTEFQNICTKSKLQRSLSIQCAAHSLSLLKLSLKNHNASIYINMCCNLLIRYLPYHSSVNKTIYNNTPIYNSTSHFKTAFEHYRCTVNNSCMGHRYR